MAKEQTTEQLDLWAQVAALRESGKKEEAITFQRKYIPLPVWGAKVMRKFCGAEFIRNSGYNLSEVEERLGKNWLDS